MYIALLYSTVMKPALYSHFCYIAYVLYSRVCYIACMLYSTRQGVICIRCYIASYMATTKVPDDTINNNMQQYQKLTEHNVVQYVQYTKIYYNMKQFSLQYHLTILFTIFFVILVCIDDNIQQ